VDAKEVNLGHLHRLIVDIRQNGDSSDETNQQLVRR
jgi:hypothetical protein